MPSNTRPITSIQQHRDNNINDALRYWGLSVIIKTEEEFNTIKRFLSEDILYLDFTPNMISRPTPTGIIIWSDLEDLDTGHVGCAEYHKKHFIRVVEFNDFFKV
jgi:hypothetical protein